MWEVRTFAPAFGNEAGAAAEAAHLPLRGGGNARGRGPVRRFEKKKLRKICRFGKFAVTLQSFSNGVSRKGSRRHGSASTLIVLQ